MWQLYVLGSLFASATEHVIDKAALVKNTQVDFLVATFWRPFLFLTATVVIGLLGWLGPLQFFFHWSILLLAPIGAFSSIFYTYLLQKVELTSTVAASYITPFLFLFIDTVFLHAPLSLIQVGGITLLVLGGIGFAVDGKTRRFKKEFTIVVWGMFLFGIIWNGSEAYLFQYLHATYALNGVSFFSTLWLITSVVLLILVLVRGKGALLFNKSSFAYVRQSALSKTCDATSTVLWVQALTLATVSQVAAFEAFDPLVLFVVVVLAQGVFRLKLNEKLSRDHLLWKLGSVCLLILGGWFAS